MEQIEGLLLSTKSSLDNFQSRERVEIKKMCFLEFIQILILKQGWSLTISFFLSLIFFHESLFKLHQNNKNITNKNAIKEICFLASLFVLL